MRSSKSQIKFSSQHANELYVSKQFSALSEYFLGALAVLKKQAWRELTPKRSRFTNTFLKTFFYLFTQEDYVLSDQHGEEFINFNPLVANLAAMSGFQTTDAWLEILRPQQANFAKILTLLNARCSAQFDIAGFFASHPKYATAWYTKFFLSFYGGVPTRRISENALRHVEHADPRWEYTGPNMASFYFYPSYFAIEREPRLKRLYHDLVKSIMAQAKVVNRPNRKSIAIVTARWERGSAVYKSLAPYVEALRHDYDLTLVRLGRYGKPDDFDKSWFKAIKLIAFVGDQFRLNEILENDFTLAYFPDIGMQNEDKHLCNLRFAPIQVMGYGHPVSTHGAEIDYFIGGQEVELLSNAGENYSERLVAIPGLGAYPVLPSIHTTGQPTIDAGAPLVINCAWYAHKFVYPHLLTLRRIAEESNQAVRFRFFVGPGLFINNHFVPFSRDVADVIGENRTEIIAMRPYAEYQRLLNEGAFSLDSYPFGGYNTIVDALALGKPVVALEGRHAINRLAAALLRRVGLEELVAKTQDEYVGIALKLIHDDAYRESIARQLATIDLEATLCRPEEPRAFKRVIDFLIENHERLKAEGSRQPILID